MRFVVTSDTHTLHDRVGVPDGDVLLHAGDFTGRGLIPEVGAFNEWLGKQPHKHRVLIAGNHDFIFEEQPRLAREMLTNCTAYLLDSEVVIEGVRIYGSPYQPRFFDWAFNLDRGRQIKAKWDLIPEGIDILMTHGPPLGHGDLTSRGEHVGCADLLDAIRRIKPKYHVFGHIHEGYGVTHEGLTTCINASALGDRAQTGRVINPPLVFDL